MTDDFRSTIRTSWYGPIDPNPIEHHIQSELLDENTNLLDVRDIGEVASMEQILNEVKLLIRMGIPVTFTYVLQYLIPLASLYCLGQIGPKELAASALSNMFASVTGWSVALGMSTALDTLCSQSFTAAEDIKVVGLHCQKGVIITILLFLPVSLVWWYSYKILLFLSIDSELSWLCTLYLRWLLIGAPAFVVFECFKKFLQAQRIMNASTYILLCTIPINLVLNYILVLNESTSLGFIGAPLAISLTYWTMLIFTILYIKYIDGIQAWGGFSKEGLNNWRQYLELGIPGVIMVCAEWWSFEIMGLATSYLGTIELASQSVIISTTNVFYMVPLGFSIATSNRIGNLIGDEYPNNCKLAAYCSMALALVLAFMNSMLLIVFKRFWASFFTNDNDVIEVVSHLLPIAALFQVFDGLTAIGGGVLRGQGRQKLGAIINLITYYVFAIPLCLYLCFIRKWGLEGIWWGLCFALATTATCVTLIVFKTDWKKQVDIALSRFD